MIFIVLFSCAKIGGPTTNTVAETATVKTNVPFAVSSLEAELRELYTDVDTVDGRARILLLQELIRSTRFAEVDVQTAVYRHVRENIRIERRSLSMDVPELSLDLSGVTSEELVIDFDTSGAESLMVQRDFKAAAKLLEVCRFDNPDCEVMWFKNQNEWAKDSFQREEEAFKRILQMPDGEEKRAALEHCLNNSKALAERFSSTDVKVLIDHQISDISALMEELP